MPTAAFLLIAAAVTASPKPGEEGTPEFEKAAALVTQLGHPRFAVREAAAKDLIEMGAAAVPALTAGAKSKDEEVRTRSTALIPQATAIEWKRRADAFLKDPTGKHDLPLLAEWDKLIGKPDGGSRKLYAEMLRTNGELLEQAAADPKAGRDAVRARCRAVLGQVIVGPDQAPATVGDLATLCFVHRTATALPVWNLDPAGWETDHPCHLLANPAMDEALNAKNVGPTLRRLLAAWVASRPADDQVTHQCFCLAVCAHPFPEAVSVLAKLAKDPKAQPLNVRALAISALGAIGDGPARAALADLVSDSTRLFRMSSYRLGDHALTTLLKTRQKDPADYGLTEVFECRFKAARQKGAATDLAFRTFHDDDARKRGLEKWKTDTVRKK